MLSYLHRTPSKKEVVAAAAVSDIIKYIARMHDDRQFDYAALSPIDQVRKELRRHFNDIDRSFRLSASEYLDRPFLPSQR